LSINKTQFYSTDTWYLTLTGAPANQSVYICAIDNRGVQSCTPTGNLGLPASTDSTGSWRASGNWNGDESVLGTWTEWVFVGGTLSGGQVNGGVRSNNITFTISRPPQTCQGSPTLVITPANASINKNQNQQFRALYDPDGPACPQAEQDKTQSVNWQSSNSNIASLVSPGSFRGNSQGTANITAIFQGLTAYATLRVIDNTPTYNPQLSINKTQFYSTDTWYLTLTG
ncbi:MAG: Ig-like domain-containing protein, partial [Minisyncoccia bacterium]